MAFLDVDSNVVDLKSDSMVCIGRERGRSMTIPACGYWGRERGRGKKFGEPRLDQMVVRRIVLEIVLLIVILGDHRAMAKAKAEQRFYPFHVRATAEEGQRHLFQNRWNEKIMWSSKTFRKGLGLNLIHRDARNSPFRAWLNDTKTDDFVRLFDRVLLRDAARVRAIDSLITRQSQTTDRYPSRKVPSLLGPPLQSRVVSGLELGSGEYFTTVSFGSPPTEVLVTLDTGSDLMWLQCHPCDSCYDQIDPIFNPAVSDSYESVDCFSHACDHLPRSTCQGMNCQYRENYGDGSFSTGEFAKETITLNSTQGMPFEIHGFFFGCGHDNEGLFTASGGLLGLGRGELSFPSQIADVLAPRFSYCLADRFFTRDEGSPPDNSSLSPTHSSVYSRSSLPSGGGSYLFFGESESEGMKYTPMLRNPSAPTFYYLQLRGISVANELVDVPTSTWELDYSSGRGGVIIDTGTAVSRLSTVAYIALRDSFRSKARQLKRVIVPNQDIFDTCFELVDGDAVPVVSLHFAGGVELVLPLDNIIIPVDDSGTLYCLAFALSDGRGDLTIIGNVQQQGFRIEFDLGKERIGFTQQDCTLS